MKLTIYRQHIFLTFFLFLILFWGTSYMLFVSKKDFLTNQLASHAQDTATFLGVTLSNHVAEGDLVLTRSIIDAVFDRGYYETISFTDVNDKVLIDRHVDIQVKGVPQWFIDLVPLQAPSSEANVMAGWLHAGVMYVKSHPGYAYHSLWKSVIDTTIWFIFCGLFVLIGGTMGLRVLLKPLYRIEEQAEALTRKEYYIQKKLPRTKELYNVVLAMNQMTIKVQEMFSEEAAMAEDLRKYAYYDSLTGLGNRRYFDAQMDGYFEGVSPISKGAMIFVRINDLMQINQERGFQAGNELLTRVAALIQNSLLETEKHVCARIGGSDIGVFLPDAPLWQGEEMAKTIAGHLSGIAEEKLSLTDNVGHIGVGVFDGEITRQRLMSEADAALNEAERSGANAWKLRSIQTDLKVPLSQNEWREALSKAIMSGRVALNVQPVVGLRAEHPIQVEAFSRIIQENGESLGAGQFIHFAERLRVIADLDRIVIENVLGFKGAHFGVDTIAINISTLSLQDDSFLEWLQSVLLDYPADAPRLIFELSEFNAVQNLPLVEKFGGLVRKFQHDIGLEHYGRSFSQLAYLQTLKPKYVKIDRAYTAELREEGSDARFYISSLCNVAHSIDIMVIAEGVETELQMNILRDLHVDAVQGYFIEKPQAIEEYLQKHDS